MKASYFWFLFLMMIFLAGCFCPEKKIIQDKSVQPRSQCPQRFEKTITKTLKSQYMLFLPKDYNKKQQKWPLILFLHGAGERGDDLSKVKIYGPPKFAEQNSNFPFIVIAPQCPADGWWPNETEVLINLLDDVVYHYDVDKDRIYLTGLSMGGYGTWSLACEYPDRFAAIAPVCGGGMPYLCSRLKNVAVWAYHGAKDKIVPLRESQEMVDAVNKAGGNAKLTIYPDVGHGAWPGAYEGWELYDWFLKHRKGQEVKK